VKRRSSRATKRAQRKAQKQAGMKRPGRSSKYAKKSTWLRNATNHDAAVARQNGEPAGRRLFGFDIIESPRPWSAS
jgi:hypothetical protein